MAPPEKKSRLALFTIITILSFAFAAIYYVSTDAYRQQSQQRLERVEAIRQTKKAAVYNDQLVLRKGERQDIERTSLIYKGLEGDDLVIDLYLLDLDKEQGYLKRIDLDEAEEHLELGNITYRLISANDRYLTLKIIARSATP